MTDTLAPIAPSAATRRYHVDEGELVVPAEWQDQSLTMFRMPGAGKDASFVITRDRETPLQDPHAYAQGQQQIASQQFPAYQALHTQEITLLDRPGVQVEYRWRASGKAMLRQRQTFVRLPECMLVFTLTALDQGFEAYEHIWANTLTSFKLRPAADYVHAHSALVLTLDVREGRLSIFDDIAAASTAISPLAVEDKLVRFFAGDGSLLEVQWTTPNKMSGLWREPGRYTLRLPEQAGANLITVFGHIKRFDARPPFDSLATLHQHLARFQPASEGAA